MLMSAVNKLSSACAEAESLDLPSYSFPLLSSWDANPSTLTGKARKRSCHRSPIGLRWLLFGVIGAVLLLLLLLLSPSFLSRWSVSSPFSPSQPFSVSPFLRLSGSLPSPFPQTLTLAHLVRSPSPASSPPIEEGIPDEAEAALSLNWQLRLAPVRALVVEGMAGLLINPMVLTGAAHMPPLFAALPCIAAASEVQPDSSTLFPRQQCTREALHLPASSSIVLSTHDAHSGVLIQQSVTALDLSATQRSRMEDGTVKASAVSSFATLCPEGVTHSSKAAQWTKGELRRNGSYIQGSTPCTMDVPAELIFGVVSPVLSRLWVEGLVMADAYAFAVQLFNGSHITEPVYSRRIVQQPQVELYQKEQRRLTSFFNHLEPPTSPSLSKDPSAPSFRRPVPFELALPSDADALCPASFQAKISEYRQWHAKQVARLLEVKDDPVALHALLTTDPHPIRILVSRVNVRSGISDRSNGLLSVYLIALLSHRVLLMDDDWTDILLTMQPSLHLPRAVIAPHLNHSSLSDLSASIPVSLEPLPTTELDRQFPSPITYIATIRGMQIRLMRSALYGPTMRSWGLSEDTVTGCVYHSLWVLRADGLMGQRGYESVLAHLLDPSNVGVGIQVRTWADAGFTDIKTEDGSEHLRERLPTQAPPSVVLSSNGVQGFFHCAHDVSDAVRESSANEGGQVRVNPVWLLVADDDEVRRAAVARWGSPYASGSSPLRLLTLQMPSLLGHSSLADPSSQLLFQQHAAVEQFLYSLCEWHIISRWSGFGRLPAAVGMKRRRVFALSLLPEERQSSSCLDAERDAMSIADIGADGSLL